MAAIQVSSYFAKFGFKLDPTSINKVKSEVHYLKKFIANQLKNIKIEKLEIGKLKINKSDINRAIKEAVNSGKGGIILPISRFSINVAELRKAVREAYYNGVVLTVNAVPSKNFPFGKTPQSRSPYAGRSTLSGAFGAGIGAAVAGATGYGIFSINQRSEDIQSSKVSLNTITGGRGVDAFQWIKNQGNALGFDYTSQLPIFSNYLGASINKQGYENSLQSFRDLTTYGLSHGADSQSMEKAMLAIGQMWSKGKIMAEELNTQLAEAKGFSGTKSIIAQAYQESIGGKLSGQKAEAALLEAMKKGQVITEKVMPIVTRLLGEQASKGLQEYQLTTAAQHNRFRNTLSNSIEVFGKGGFDEGMMRFFKFLSEFLDKHSEDIRRLGKGFLELEKAFERIVSGSGALMAVLVPLWAVINTGIGKFGLLVGVLDEISVFISGGDSLLGRLTKYLEDLTGLDYNVIASGMAVVGFAITRAFSPMIAAVVAIGALIEAYKYVQGLKSKELPSVPSSGAPSLKDINNASSINLAKATENSSGFLGKSYSWFRLASNAAGNATGFSFDTLRGYQYANSGTVNQLGLALKEGLITEDEQDRYFRAMGVGLMSVDQVISNLSQIRSRRDNPNIFPARQIPPIEITLNGSFNNERVNVMDLLGKFPSQSSQPLDQIPTTP